MTAAAVVIIIAGVKAAVSILIPFLLAAFIAIVCSPALSWLRRKKVPEWAALILIVAVVFAAGLIVVTILGSSIQDFTRDLPAYEAKLRNQVSGALAWLKNLGVDVSGIESMELLDVGAAMRLTASALNNLRGVLTNGFLIILTVIFMLLEASGLPDKLRTAFGDKNSVMSGLDEFLSKVNRYMAIKTAISLITGVIVTIWLVILGVNYPLLWGLLAFLLNYVPNIGSIIAAVPAVLLAFVQLGSVHALGVGAGYLAVNVIMGNAVEPRFMGEGLGLSTLVVFLSLLFWGWVLGPVGMFLSVPLTIMVKIALDSSEETRWLAILLGR
jgi:predicted PurR-regulated permease PerM